ncbi:GDSL esterase/lipase At3g48460-like [Olea europaea var. sylvestris]|uniref:GDSL esterase/lipase At3g48460-like n=1 Tax=Olea europaea var. sylvestris TaxID=158386 RepID=UPI000C1D2428|nr:GDSL esterase/lipase At3g48460-like [Olea europaea var. sylvestris]
MVPQIVCTIANPVRKVIRNFGDIRVGVLIKFDLRVPFVVYIYLAPFALIYLDSHFPFSPAAAEVRESSIPSRKTLGFGAIGVGHIEGYNPFVVTIQAIEELKIEHPNTTIIYGFDLNSLQKACRGSGGTYKFNLTKMCGLPGVSVCPSPSRCMSWDGIHLTQHAYKLMAGWLIRSFLPKLQNHV